MPKKRKKSPSLNIDTDLLNFIPLINLYFNPKDLEGTATIYAFNNRYFLELGAGEKVLSGIKPLDYDKRLETVVGQVAQLQNQVNQLFTLVSPLAKPEEVVTSEELKRRRNTSSEYHVRRTVVEGKLYDFLAEEYLEILGRAEQYFRSNPDDIEPLLSYERNIVHEDPIVYLPMIQSASILGKEDLLNPEEKRAFDQWNRKFLEYRSRDP